MAIWLNLSPPLGLLVLWGIGPRSLFLTTVLQISAQWLAYILLNNYTEYRKLLLLSRSEYSGYIYFDFTDSDHNYIFSKKRREKEANTAGVNLGLKICYMTWVTREKESGETREYLPDRFTYQLIFLSTSHVPYLIYFQIWRVLSVFCNKL